MTIEQLQSVCKKMPGVTEDIKWEDHLCFNVGGKMFIITSPDRVPHSASFKANDDDFAELSEIPGCMPAPYLARHKWIHVDDINRFSAAQWQHYASEAYRLVASKLPAKVRKELGI